MYAAKRWAYHFVTNLECVRCRKKHDRKLVSFKDGKEIVSDEYSLNGIKDMVPYMDVWCSDCIARGFTDVTMRVRGEGRLRMKEEAARLADILANAEWQSTYDTHLLPNGKTLTKAELVATIKESPCQGCGGTFPASVMDFYKIHPPWNAPTIRRMVSRTYTMEQLVAEIGNCALLCANCIQLVQSGHQPVPENAIVLDENLSVVDSA